MADIVEIVKTRNRIEDVIAESGFKLSSQRGKYMRGASPDYNSLVINVEDQFYVWNSKNEAGDLINWIQNREDLDFKTAVEKLARRARIPEPEWSREDNKTRLATRAKQDILTVAARKFVLWLRDSDTAMEYATGRGWTDETIRAAGLGYSGKWTKKEIEDLAGDYAMNQIDTNSKPARAIAKIPAKMLVYPHLLAGRVRYISSRSISGKKHWNLPVKLVGSRQIFYNHVYRSRAPEVVIVEGQADAVTFGQWGIPAVAMAGVSFKDKLDELRDLRERHETIYIGIDADQAGDELLTGQSGEWPLASVFGPMARIIKWDYQGSQS